MAKNHVIDPNFFQDVNDEFAFDYIWYSEAKIALDDLGRKITKYNKLLINGSLQPGVRSFKQSLNGNRHEMEYDFYCMSKYRIETGDFIYNNFNYLLVTDVFPYDEFGVRHVKLKVINLNQYKDLKDALKYLEGEIIV